jgi:hypothetical protein
LAAYNEAKARAAVLACRNGGSLACRNGGSLGEFLEQLAHLLCRHADAGPPLGVARHCLIGFRTREQGKVAYPRNPRGVRPTERPQCTSQT